MSLRNAVRSLVINTVLVRELMQSGVAYNPTSARLAQDPYPTYAGLRERDPVHRSRLMDAWIFSRHADVDAILRGSSGFRVGESDRGTPLGEAAVTMQAHAVTCPARAGGGDGRHTV